MLVMQVGWHRVTRTEPPTRIITALAYDSSRRTIVMFGGDRMKSTPVGDTWEWDGAQWVQRDSSGPSPRYGHVASWSPANGGVLLFGGFDKSVTMFADSWLWKDRAWHQ